MLEAEGMDGSGVAAVDQIACEQEEMRLLAEEELAEELEFMIEEPTVLKRLRMVLPVEDTFRVNNRVPYQSPSHLIQSDVDFADD